VPASLTFLFWICAAIVVYAYLVYPLLLGIAARFRGQRGPANRKNFRGSVSIILAAHNEETTIRRRLEELTRLLANYEADAELIVVSDGSTDDTVRIARGIKSNFIQVLELPVNRGKAIALSQACSLARHEILVFADARQTWSPQALNLLLENFSDPTIGAVSGDLIVRSTPGVMEGVGLYWRYEKWLRKQESRVHSMVGVTGAICAVRKELFHPIPQGIILDDVYWPLQVAMQGYRVVHDERACAYDRLPDKARDEFRRKVRTLSGNLQLLSHLPAALLPWKNPVWLQFVSHKLFRLVVPWALLAMLALAFALPERLYQIAWWAQIGFYAVGLAGIGFPVLARVRPVAAVTSFLVLNSAAWLAFWIWLLGLTENSWTKVLYPSASVAGVEGSPVSA
jgi:cellulose synthase/poly-beta-1,6-N-acetylglucosamine synthase-like glycosyltransferase